MFGPLPGWHHSHGLWCRWFYVLEHHYLQESSLLSSYCVWPMETEHLLVVGGGLWGEDARRDHKCISSCTEVTTLLLVPCCHVSRGAKNLTKTLLLKTHCDSPLLWCVSGCFVLAVLPITWWVECNLELQRLGLILSLSSPDQIWAVCVLQCASAMLIWVLDCGTQTWCVTH